MNLSVERADIWVAGMKDEPGGLAKILAGLQEAGANLEFVLARRCPEEPGTGVVFMTPLKGDSQLAAAADLGVKLSNSVFSVRVEGDNGPGVGAALTAKLAAAGINLRGLSAGAIGDRFVLYLGLDTAEDAAKAVNVLSGV